MLTELLQDRCALYAAGFLSPAERDSFDLILDSHPEVQDLVGGLQEVSTALVLATMRNGVPAPPAGLLSRVLAAIDGRPQEARGAGFVMCGTDGLVEWVNAEFSAMCGYSLDDLRGRKLGPILQGAATCPETADRMRQAVQELRPCRETILNYHKSGSPYWAEIAITPVCDESGQPLWLVAREREVAEPVAA